MPFVVNSATQKDLIWVTDFAKSLSDGPRKM